MQREHFNTRLGFLLVAAGCAIGLGNIWRFPWLVGEYGGGFFVLLYVIFLILCGMPIMTAEFAVGRASQKSVARSFHVLQPEGSKWSVYSYFAMGGNYMLMMFYTTVAGWMLAYLFKAFSGSFIGATPDEIGGLFGAHVGTPTQNAGWMIAICVLGFAIVALGLQKGVEKITKACMSLMFLLLIILIVRAVTLPGAIEGLKFFLIPSAEAFETHSFGSIANAALGQAFFSLSLGMGSMAIFGSYIKKEKRLAGESVNVILLDTCAAIGAGLMIFPTCFAFDMEPGAGPGLIFMTLPNIFGAMPGGYVWAILFFFFMTFAALSTVIAVFENIVAFALDLTSWTRMKAVAVNAVAVILLSLPCALGFNIWAEPLTPLLSWLGEGAVVIDFEDFIVSNHILPIGSAIYLLFCMSKKGWGFDNFLAEANAGDSGMRFPAKLRWFFTWVLPVVIAIVFIMGYVGMFFS